jgi:HEAT repeat protein
VDNHKLPDDDDLPTQELPGPSRKYPWAILVVVVLFVVIPFISWYGTWFGRPLSDSKMTEFLHDQNKPRNVQHALAQLADRITAGDQSAKRFYPDVIAAAQNPQAEVRMTAGWVMGQDNTYQDFHSALLELLRDPSGGVRHNAALGLVRFGDSTARPELTAMLKSYPVHAETSGVVGLIVKEAGTAVAPNAPLARIRQADGEIIESRAPEAGRVESIAVSDGGTIEAGGELLTLSPSAEQVWEALRALYLVGQPEDIASVQRYLRPVSTMPDKIQKQAAFTLEAIRDRAAKAQ